MFVCEVPYGTQKVNFGLFFSFLNKNTRKGPFPIKMIRKRYFQNFNSDKNLGGTAAVLPCIATNWISTYAISNRDVQSLFSKLVTI